MTKITVVPVERFELEFNDLKLGEFKVESKWEGMVKLRRHNGDVMIIKDDSSFVDNMFKDFFKDKDNFDCSKEFEIISASPDLLKFIMDKKDVSS